MIEVLQQKVTRAPILANKDYTSPSVFRPESMLREARRQKALECHTVPPVCVLDPDGDIVRGLRTTGQARADEQWACYHTDLYRFDHGEHEMGVVGCAVGGSFAVLVAEELFACGCQLLISMTSAGQILQPQNPPYFVLIEKALRDEGTSYHYLAPSEFAEADPDLIQRVDAALSSLPVSVLRGATWTIDAPFRETEGAIDSYRSQGLIAVEMEAAALYAFARARQKPVICLAHVTNQMGRIEGDFEKGLANGAEEALAVIGAAVRGWESAA
jgi:uridine phosphorylase